MSQDVERTFFKPKVCVRAWLGREDERLGRKFDFTLSTLTFEEDELGFCCFFGGMIDERGHLGYSNWVRVDPYIYARK